MRGSFPHLISTCESDPKEKRGERRKRKRKKKEIREEKMGKEKLENK